MKHVCNYSGTSLLRSPTGLGKSDPNGEVTLLQGVICTVEYNLRLSQGDCTKTTGFFITFYSRRYYLEARSQGGNGGKLTQCNTISKPDIMPRGLKGGV